MFWTKGPLPPDSPLFVGRTQQLATIAGWCGRADCVGAVLGARQTGKTSLLLRARHEQAGKFGFVFIDLQAIEGAESGACFRYLSREVLSQLSGAGCCVAVDGEAPSDSPSFLAFLKEVSTAAGMVRIVIVLDEFGAMPRATATRLAHTLRSAFTTRLVNPALERFVFVLSGATDLLEWTVSGNSPLRNVTDSIYLDDLSKEDCCDLLPRGVEGLDRALTAGLIQDIYAWTGGHPYWTQLIGSRICTNGGAPGIVSQIVDKLLQDEDSNLPHLARSVERSDAASVRLLSRILLGERVQFRRSDARIAELEVMGAIRNEGGFCAIRNQIYGRALRRHFDCQEPQVNATSPSALQDSSGGARCELFVSYSHRDRKWLDRLRVMLTPLLRDTRMSLWDDGKIQTGSDWRREIQGAIDRASVAILLVSPDFLASEFIAANELPPLLNAAQLEGVKIAWIAVSDSLYQRTSLGNFQAANDPSKPLDSLDRAAQNKVIRGICEKIIELL